MVHEDYKELLVALALNALEPADVRDVEAHLRTCAECRAQFSEWEDTAANLAFVSLEAKPLEPSPQLRGRILEAIRVDGARRVATSETRPSNVIPLKRPGTWSSPQTWSAIAAGLVLVALVASLFVLWSQNREARNELALLSEQMRVTKERLDQQNYLIGIIAVPGARMTELAGTPVMPGAHAKLAYDKDGRAILMATGLPAAPAGMAYQLWFIAGGQPMPGKVFTTDASGAGMLKDQIPSQARSAAVFAITLEPAAGVQKPTGQIYLSGPS